MHVSSIIINHKERLIVNSILYNICIIGNIVNKLSKNN